MLCYAMLCYAMLCYAMQLGRPLEGALVVDVLPGSPAAAAGLRPSTFRGDGSVELGDLLTAVADVPVRQA